MKLIVSPVDSIKGEISIDGSKNAVLPQLVCCLLTNKKIILNNVPNITDVNVMLKLLKEIGVKIAYNIEDKQIILQRKKRIKNKISLEAKQLRASYYLMGSLFSVKKSFSTYYPGGCKFEKRPIDFHLEALSSFGACVEQVDEQITISRKRKRPNNIILKKQSVGCTINIILASVLTQGTTIIKNPSLEPEVLELINLLIKMGASITYDNNQVIINGVKRLKGATNTIIADRMEAGSYMFLACAAKQSNLKINNVCINYLSAVIKKIKEINVTVLTDEKSITIIKDKPIKGTSIIADVYPFFPTDLQQIACTALLNASSISLIRDYIYPNRFSEILELLSIGAKLVLKNNILLVAPSTLNEGTMTAYDLRGGFSLIVAAINAKGSVTIENAEVIKRGYSNLVPKLEACGVKIKEVIY